MSEGDLRQQIEVTKEFLEYSHGSALRTEHVDEAKAYYEAITLVEDGLEHNWEVESGDPEVEWGELGLEFIEESRKAREEGVKAATLHEKRLRDTREKYHQPSLLDILLPWRSTEEVSEHSNEIGGR